MSDFPILQRTRVDLWRQYIDMHPNHPRRRVVALALRDATTRLLRRQLEAARRASRPATDDDLFALIARGPAIPPVNPEARHVA